ncbi:MAG: cell envelope integrity protein TolA, partial [Proteobacteria bacterium]|nr:cell envelope integrity protein TolA [Pseudomonadota bacterium]
KKKKAEAEKKRKAAEKKKKAEAEKKRKAAEKKKKAEAEKKRKAAEKKKKAAAEKKRKAAEKKKKAAAEKKRKAAEKKKKAAAEKKRKAAEKKKKAAEKKAQEAAAAQAQREQDEYEAVSAFGALAWAIQEQVSRNWSESGDFTGMSASFLVKVDRQGRVTEVTMTHSSGDARLDESAENAIYKASPLPFPSEARYYEYLKEFNFVFKPSP